ncbi:MAG: NTP transferase domain-containing protein [Syntrophobacteraceae bacterium]
MAEIAAIVFAAGKGTRMTGYDGNKTLLPLVPGKSIFEGERPLIREVLDNLPPGPKGVVVNHRAEDVRDSTRAPGIEYIHQPRTNGTGGALLAARPFIERTGAQSVIITMGDVPLIRPATYRALVEMLGTCDMALLAFEPEDRARYGMLEMEGERVARIVEWKYWSDPQKFPPQRRAKLRCCNAGVYAAGRKLLLEYMGKLEDRPHEVLKEIEGRETLIREYFLTDIAEMMHADGLFVGMARASEAEVTGVDTPASLAAVQKMYAQLAMARDEGPRAGSKDQA